MLSAQHISESNKVNPSLHFKPQFFQPKLTVNSPGDVYEQEADAMADKVMRMTIPQKRDTFFKPALSSIQKKPTHSTGTDELEDERLHRQEIPGIRRKCAACEEEDKKVHRKEFNGQETKVSNELDSYVSTLSATGQPLTESSRQFFEPRFGKDFSNVNIHTDSVAAKSAQSINALAYTTGNNIVFNAGQYSPDSESGKRLMAHELTHVIQQESGEKKVHKQGLPARNGCADLSLRKVSTGPFEGGFTLDHYYPDLAGKGRYDNPGVTGLYDTGAYTGAKVQFIATFPSFCPPANYTMGQTVTYTKAIFDGVRDPKEGVVQDDFAKSGRNTSAPPFRRDWLGNGYNVSTADFPYTQYREGSNVEYDRNFVTTITGSESSASVSWSTSIRVVKGIVLKNTIT